MASAYAPVLDIGAASERMADNHDVIPLLVQLAPGLVRDGDIAQAEARLQYERWYHQSLLLKQRCKGSHGAS